MEPTAITVREKEKTYDVAIEPRRSRERSDGSNCMN
jgi:hypothetical protein